MEVGLSYFEKYFQKLFSVNDVIDICKSKFLVVKKLDLFEAVFVIDLEKRCSFICLIICSNP